MCDAERHWSPEIYCGPYGQCVNSVCICEEGWGADWTVFKTQNCWLPYPAVEVIDGATGILCFLAFLLSLIKLRGARSYLRSLLMLTSLSMLFAASYCLAHLLEGGTFGLAALILLNFALRFASDGIALAMYHMLKSFWKMSGKGKSLKRYVIGCQVLEAFGLTAACVAGIVYKDDPDRFSIAMTIFLLILAIHFAGLQLFVIVSTRRVIRTVEGAPALTVTESMILADGSPRAEERRKSFLNTALSAAGRRVSGLGFTENSGSTRVLDIRSQELVNKVKLYRRFGRLAGPLVVIVVFVLCCIEWILGSVPLMWVLYGIAVLHFPVVGFAQTLLARKSSLSSRDLPISGGSSSQLLLSSSSPKQPRPSVS